MCRFAKSMVFASAIFLFGLSSSVFAAGVGVDKARPVANNWLSNTLAAEKTVTGSQYKIVREEVIKSHGKTVGYNFILSPAGHIIVPARDELPVVKLYSLTSTVSVNDGSEASEWISDELYKLGEAIDAHASEFASVDQSTTFNGKLWARFSKTAAEFAAAADGTEGEGVSYGPLTTTTWDQGEPYNLQTPLWSDGVRTVTGCVATAAAQIMRYWNWPPTGQGSTSYTWNNGSTNVTLSANFASSTYDWTNMPVSYSGGESTAQKNAVAKLMSDAGIAFHMNYHKSTDGGSSASTMDGVTVYPTYFNYKNTIQGVYRQDYASDSDWMKVFKAEVQINRPCQMRLRDPNQGGHSIVVDGYRDTPAEQIHLNLGWSGSYNGWYVSNNIVTGGYNWSDVNYQGAVIGIQPNQQSSTPCAGLCTNPTTFSIAPYGSYQSGNIGTGAVCYETTSPVAGGNCGNFVSPRTLKVNGVTETCNYQNWASVPAKRNGGYCIQTTAGSHPWAYFSLWRGQ